MWKYSNPHMKISDADAAHCVTYALGGNCGNDHVRAFEFCTILAHIFDMSFEYFINAIVLKQLNNEQLLSEENATINSGLCFTLSVKHCTSHRV